MHKEILNKNQLELLPLVKQFKREFYLVGGTAIALHMGHRRSIDFDLFKSGRLVLNRIITKISIIKQPYPVDVNCKFEDIIKLPDLLNLASMKAFALGRRSKWKDYVDLYYILKDHYSVKQIAEMSCNIYGQLFSEKLFRAQLSYFDDIDYGETIEYLIKQPTDKEIKKFLIENAVDVS